MGYTRRLSPSERLWLVADRIRPPFVNQLVVEGVGALDPDAWREAVAAAGAANPGSRLFLRGLVGWSRWVATDEGPPVREVDGAAWEGLGPAGAPFLEEALDPRKGPTCEVLLVAGARPRVVFRTHHAVMDGRGTLAFVDDVFRALAGEAPLGADATVTDLELARSLGDAKPGKRAQDCPAPTGESEGDEEGVIWGRRTVRGAHRNLLPRLMVAIAGLVRGRVEGAPVRIDVPVDMRPHRPELRSTGNLTGIVHVPVPAEATVESVAGELREAVARHEEAITVRAIGPLVHMPLWMMLGFGRAGMRQSLKKDRFLSTGVLSNLGRLDLARFAGGGFRPTTAFFIPPGTDSNAFFLASTGHAGGVELVLTVPRKLATGGRLDEALDALADALRTEL